MKKTLIVFTRYPEPGKTKTRLIPVLGAEGAANLHRQMAEYAIAQAKQLTSSHQVSVEVHFTGGNLNLMRSWLGNDIIYQPQIEGDIGLKMSAAFKAAFNQNINYVSIIGSDCPKLNYQLISQAFDSLLQHDLVIGPATDGGYYLIGLSRFIPELFKGINWSTAEVFQQTIEIAARLNLSVAYLPKLSDIDRPEDLAILDFRFSIEQPRSQMTNEP
ncbi:MAG TPA: TIGR04282 family arsenosugar biosynthesis glycosyltransferase [Leptolyngbyaceae cyanobacterium]